MSARQPHLPGDFSSAGMVRYMEDARAMRLARQEPAPVVGPARTPSGREVYGTGKVLIGIRAGEQQPTSRDLDWLRPTEPMSRDAEQLQDALIRHNRERADEAAPYLNQSLTARFLRLLDRLFGGPR